MIDLKGYPVQIVEDNKELGGFLMIGRNIGRNKKMKSSILGLLAILMLIALTVGIASCGNSGIDDVKRAMPVGEDVDEVSSSITIVSTDNPEAFCNLDDTVKPNEMFEVEEGYPCDLCNQGVFVRQYVESGNVYTTKLHYTYDARIWECTWYKHRLSYLEIYCCTDTNHKK